MNQQVWWYLARSSGIIAWVAITLSVLWGLTLSTRVLGKTAPPAWILDLHRFFGASAIIFTGLHIGGLVGDNYLHFGWSEVLIPYASPWKTAPVALGVVGFYLLCAVELSSLVMRKLPKSLWRWVHRTSWILFVIVTFHGLQAGTDVHNVYYRWVALASVQLVLFLTRIRVMAQRKANRRNAAKPQPAPAAQTPASTSAV